MLRFSKNVILETNPLGDIFYDYTYQRLAKKRYSNIMGNNVTYTYGTVGTERGRPVLVEDGTGRRELTYDALGNVISEVRTISIPSSDHVYRFTTGYTYDSWGRMLTMTYPDGEVLKYTYGYGGDLISMCGDKGSEHHVYVPSITYNDFGQRSRIDYENGTYATYHYDALHRLDSLYSMSASGAMQRIKYSFDGVGNITRVRNHATALGTLGGQYTNLHSYDALNRLALSGTDTDPLAVNTAGTYSLDMGYSTSGRLASKIVTSTGNYPTNGNYVFGYCSTLRPHAPVRIFEQNNQTLSDLVWDDAGNLSQVNTLIKRVYDASRFLFWTEDNRLHTVADDKHYSYYAYDHAGERTLKLTGSSSVIDVNAESMSMVSELNEVTLYPTPYIVLSNRGYTKHYYVGSDRLCARIGGGDLQSPEVNTELGQRASELFDDSVSQCSDRVLLGNDEECVDYLGEICHAQSALRGPLDLVLHSDLPSVDGVPQSLKPIVTVKTTYFESAIEDYFTNRVPEDEAYFYHSDHLGGANWITDSSGLPVQHLQLYYHARFSSTRSTGACSTFGEPFVNQHTSGYQRSTTKDGAATHKAPLRGPLDLVPFTGKERDAETGFSYFGARYYDSDLSGQFLSVDPMEDKYPSISPYAYCAWNPMKLVDPDGREVGDYYTTNGTWLGSDGKKDDLAYTATSVQKNSQGFVISAENKELLPILNSELLDRAIRVCGESGGSGELITSRTQNIGDPRTVSDATVAEYYAFAIQNAVIRYKDFKTAAKM